MGVAGLEAIRQEVCIGSGCPYGGAPIPVLQKVSAPNAWVPLWLCPNGCAPKSQCPKCLGAPMAVPQTTVPLQLCPKCSAPRSGFHANAGENNFMQVWTNLCNRKAKSVAGNNLMRVWTNLCHKTENSMQVCTNLCN